MKNHSAAAFLCNKPGKRIPCLHQHSAAGKLLQFSHPCYAYENVGYFIPGTEVDDTGLGQAEDGLECHHRFLSSRAEDAVRRNSGNGGVDGGDGVQLLLDLLHLLAGGAYGKVITRPGSRDPLDLFGGVDVDGIAVEVAEDLDGAVALFAQGAGTPLCQPNSNSIYKKKPPTPAVFKIKVI